MHGRSISREGERKEEEEEEQQQQQEQQQGMGWQCQASKKSADRGGTTRVRLPTGTRSDLRAAPLPSPLSPSLN